MDHIQLPSTARNARHLRVPCLFRDGFAGSWPMAERARLLGWTPQDLENPANWSANTDWNGSPGRRSKADVDAFLQNWAFFGHVQTFFAPSCSLAFIETDVSGSRWITLQHVKPLLALRTQYYLHIPIALFESWLQVMDNCITLVLKLLSFVYKDHSRVDSCILHSITVLGDIISTFLFRRLTNRKAEMTSNLQISFLENWPLANTEHDVMSQKLLGDGWCPNQVRLLGRLSPSARYFATFLQRPAPVRIHTRKCSRLRCVAYQTDQATYKTSHRCEAGDCEVITMDPIHYLDVLEQDDIPLVRLRQSQGKYDPEYSRVSSAARYIAFSHVWSDGLGSPFVNGLPLCQLKYLDALADALYPDERVFFWIDTLCCPVTPEHARQKAIRLMTRTYADADKVLVIDRYLSDSAARPMSPFEIAIRIYCCTWVGRLWTLQEGMLARNLYFQFYDGAISFLEFFQTLLDYDEPGFEFKGGLLPLLSQYGIRKRSETSATPHLNSLATISTYVIDRNTSRPSDEAICLANLLGQDVRTILKQPLELRMQEFWRIQTSIPSSIVFHHWVPKLTAPGFRWAPSTFMNAENAIVSENREPLDQIDCKRTNQGLWIEYPGFILTNDAPFLTLKRFWIVHPNGADRMLVALDQWIICSGSGAHLRGLHGETLDVSQEETHKPRTHALILRAELASLDSAHNRELAGLHVALACITKRTESVIYAQLLTPGLILHEQAAMLRFPDRSEAGPKHVKLESMERNFELEELHGDSQVFTGAILDATQKWCLA